LPQYRNPNSNFLKIRSWYDGSHSWYYVYRDRLVAEYSNRSGELLGWFGPDGYFPGPAKPRGFEGTLRPADEIPFQTLLTFDVAVYRIELEGRQVEKVFQPVAGESVLAAGSTMDVPDNFLSIATTRRLIVQSNDGDLLFERPHAAPIDKYPTIETYQALGTPEKPFLLWYANGFRPESGSASRAVKLDAEGRTIQELDLPGILYPEQARWAEMVVVLPVVPLAARTVVELAEQFRIIDRLAPWEASAELNATSWLMPAALSVAFAGLTYRRGKKYAFTPRRLWFWTILTLLLGPISFFLMLAVIEWPALELCPSCGRPRVVTNELCEHCSQPFALPEMDGTEIFDFRGV